MVEKSFEHLGPLTAMVANAGTVGVGAAIDLADGDVAQVMNDACCAADDCSGPHSS